MTDPDAPEPGPKAASTSDAPADGVTSPGAASGPITTKPTTVAASAAEPKSAPAVAAVDAPTDAKPADAKPAPRPAVASNPDAKPAGAKPTDGKSADAKPAAAKPAAAKPAPPAEDEDEDDPNELPLPPPWWKTLRADPPTYVRMALGFGLIALLLGLWWFVTRGSATERIISPSKLPSPGEVFGAFGELTQRDLMVSIFDTLQRVFTGVGLAALVGITLGVLAASNRGFGATLAPLVIFLRSVPMSALIPLTLLLFGDGERQKMMFIFLALIAFVFSDTVKAISNVPERYVETAQTLGASRFQIIRKVLVPLALPDIITSLRFQLGLALGYIMLVEIIDTPHGLGKLLTGSERQGLSEHVYLLLFVIALIAFTLDLVFRTLQRGAFTWRRDL